MKRHYFSTFEIVLLSQFALLIVIAKLILKIPIHIPGHSAIFWVALLMLARSIINKNGAGTYVGVFSGILAVFLGVGKGALLTFPKYLIMGIMIDILLYFFGGISSALVAGVVGAAVNISKLVVSWIVAQSLGIPVFFIGAGLSFAALTHAIFGFMGGLVGYWVFLSLKKAKFMKYIEERQAR